MTGLQFSSSPSKQEIGRSYPILRCDADQKWRLSGFILSSQVYGLDVHYVGKSVPCYAHSGECQWCALGRATRWVGYVPCCDHNRQKQFIMELTPGVMPSIVAYQEQHDSLRGAMVHLSRRKQRATARLDIEVLPAGRLLSPGDLPPTFDIERALYKIFGLEADGTDPTHPRVNELQRGQSAESTNGALPAEPSFKASSVDALAQSRLLDDDILDDEYLQA